MSIVKTVIPAARLATLNTTPLRVTPDPPARTLLWVQRASLLWLPGDTPATHTAADTFTLGLFGWTQPNSFFLAGLDDVINDALRMWAQATMIALDGPAFDSADYNGAPWYLKVGNAITPNGARAVLSVQYEQVSYPA